VKKRLLSFVYAFRGIKVLYRDEPNAWIHTVALLMVLAAGFYFQISNHEWLAVIICIGMVFSAELLNTAIEHICNFINPNFDKRIGVIKDLAAAGVLLSAIASLIVGLIIFLPKLSTLI